MWLFLGDTFLQGIHPFLTGNEVTQPRGIPGQPVTGLAAGMCVPKSALVSLGAVSASGHLASWQSSGLRCIATFFSPLGSLALGNVQRFSAPATRRNQRPGANCCLVLP